MISFWLTGLHLNWQKCADICQFSTYLELDQLCQENDMFTFLYFLYFDCFFQGRKVKIKKVWTAFQKPTPLLFNTFLMALPFSTMFLGLLEK